MVNGALVGRIEDGRVDSTNSATRCGRSNKVGQFIDLDNSFGWHSGREVVGCVDNSSPTFVVRKDPYKLSRLTLDLVREHDFNSLRCAKL